jgi:hypothetical protein
MYDDTDDRISNNCWYRSNKGNMTQRLGFNDMYIHGMHRGRYGHPGSADDHWLERHLDHVFIITEPRVTH